MSTVTISEIAAEPEEILESSLCAVLSQAVSIPVEGSLTPATEGTVKNLSEDSFVSVSVDLASQDLDLATPAQFITLSASVTVRYAQSDDADGSSFRDECCRVRAALVSLTGDGCSSLTTSAMAVDGFVLKSTSHSFDTDENPVFRKTYAATAICRVLIQTTTNEQEATNG